MLFHSYLRLFEYLQIEMIMKFCSRILYTYSQRLLLNKSLQFITLGLRTFLEELFKLLFSNIIEIFKVIYFPNVFDVILQQDVSYEKEVDMNSSFDFRVYCAAIA